MGLSYTDACPFNAEFSGREISESPILADVLLIPTKIYCSPVVGLLNHLESVHGSVHAVHGIAHITGGGLSNLLRLHDSLGGISKPRCQYLLNSHGYNLKET